MSETVDAIDTEHEEPPASAVAEPASAIDSASASANENAREDGDDALVHEGDVAGDYLERLLDLLDYDGDIDLDVEAGRAVVSIDGGEDLEKLVGGRGQVLEA